MLAGLVLRSWTRRIDMDVERLEQKLDAVGYGIFIPLFFVCSGMTLDIRSIMSNPVRLLVFVALLLVALAEIGQHDGVMLPSNAAAIVGAGVVSVLLFPAIATVLRRTGSSRQQRPAETLPLAAADDSGSPA